jgi:hypothetical protein
MADAHHRRWVEAGAPWNGISNWIPADKELPSNPRCVLATDMECHFIAINEDRIDGALGRYQWSNAHTGEEIDSVITHWMELPEVPIE